MYGIEERDNLLTYIDGVFIPLARPAQASDIIVNIAGFGTSDWDDPNGVCEGLKSVLMGPKCTNVASHGFKCSTCGYDLDNEACDRIGGINYCPLCGSEIVKNINPDPGKVRGE
jgi:hypothetical protein